uniref:Helicase/UvrB N-terminal domain-containing protein n=1 Tax=viral metagenome TaxID=1070528 RepID=A0A6C0HXM1_9ZZZZ
MAIYEQQIRVMEENLARFQEQAWGMLLAPMQSGKTSSFLLTACEMMRSGKVDRAVIFTGCRDTDLRAQLNDDKLKFKELYQLFLHSQGVEGHDLISGGSLVDNIKIYFGQDLDTCEAQDKTLYIWEESHYGQSHKQEVDLFLRRMGIQATGILPGSCFMLSVSATPFSELSDHHHMTQDKFVVRLIPSDQYLSVKKMMTNGQIRTMKDPVKELADILRPVQDGYVLIRATKTQQAKMTSIAIASGFEVVQCDMDHNYDLNTKLKHLPTKKTLIFIKGRCRMGKKLDKTHLRVCMETSSGKTDTLLQSLIGRVCGYDSRPDILIYVKNLPLEELEKYNALHEGDFTSIPSKAMNVVRNTKTRSPLKPICIILDEDPEACLARNVLQKINHLQHENSVEDMAIALPIIRQLAEAFSKLPTDRSPEEKKMAKHWIQHKKGAVYKAAMPLIEEAYRSGTAQCEFGSGAGASATEDEVVVWRNKRRLYITMQVEKGVVPVTTKREVFCRETVDGGAMFVVPPTTRKDPLELKKALDALIEASRELGPGKLTSNGFGEYILLTEPVFEYLQTLASEWKTKGVILKTKKVRKPAGMTDVRLSEISWTQPSRLPTVADHMLSSSQ